MWSDLDFQDPTELDQVCFLFKVHACSNIGDGQTFKIHLGNGTVDPCASIDDKDGGDEKDSNDGGDGYKSESENDDDDLMGSFQEMMLAAGDSSDNKSDGSDDEIDRTLKRKSWIVERKRGP